jgi:hypothetical protein
MRYTHSGFNILLTRINGMHLYVSVYVCTVYAGVFPKTNMIDCCGRYSVMKDPEYVHSSCMHLWHFVLSSGNFSLTCDSSVISPQSCKWIWNYGMWQNRAKSKIYLWLIKTCTINEHVELEILGHAVLTSVPMGVECLASSLGMLPLEKMVLYALYKWLVP